MTLGWRHVIVLGIVVIVGLVYAVLLAGPYLGDHPGTYVLESWSPRNEGASSEPEPKALDVAESFLYRTAELADWDTVRLSAEFQALPPEVLHALGFDEKEMARIANEAEQAIRAMQDGQDWDQVPEPPEEATTNPGDLWLLGPHRLLCGNAGRAEDLDRLLDGAPIHLVNTDPPYNVKVEPRSNNAIAAGLSSFTATHHQGLDVARQG